MGIYNYFKWNGEDLINGCEPEVIKKAHSLEDTDEIYFITLDGNPFFVIKNKTEEEILLYIATLEENALQIQKQYEASNHDDSPIEITEELNKDEFEVTEEELAKILAETEISKE